MSTAVLAAQLLSRAFERYEQAYDDGDPSSLVEARYELSLALVSDGWQPPPVVVAQMERDRTALPAPRVIQL